MTSFTWRLGPLIIALSCGLVVLIDPVELQYLGLSETAGVPFARFYLAVISLCSLVAALRPGRHACVLFAASVCLFAYAAGALIGRDWAALPSAGYASVVALFYADRAVAIRAAGR